MPPRELQAYLWDIARSARLIEEFTEGKTFQDYKHDVMLRSAVERQFEIIGEALNQATRRFPDVENEISSSTEIIAFRNLLIHAYATVNPAIVWGVVEDDLPTLIRETETLLNSRAEGR